MVKGKVKSLWELAGYPADMRDLPSSGFNPDLLFQAREAAMEVEHADVCEKVETTLAWGFLREDINRLLYRHSTTGYIDVGSHAEPGPLEQLDFEAVKTSIEAEAAAMRDEQILRGVPVKVADEAYDKRVADNLFGVAPERPELSGSVFSRPWWRKHLLTLSAGVAFSVGLIAALLSVLLVSVGSANPAAEFIVSKSWWWVYGVLGFAVFWFWHSRLGQDSNGLKRDIDVDDPEVSVADTRRGNWPFYVLGSILTPVVFAAPFLVSAVLIPASVFISYLVLPRGLRRRVVESVSEGGTPIRLGEFTGQAPQDRNMFVDPMSSIKAESAALPASLPAFSRMGDMFEDITSSRESAARVASHCLVLPTPEGADDVSSVASSLVFDAVAGAAGMTDPVNAARYGNGVLRLVAKATALATGYEVVSRVKIQVSDLKPASVGDWWKSESEAYIAAVGKLLPNPDDQLLALQEASLIIDSVALEDFDIPWLVRLRFETISYALRHACSSLS